jgi:RimJ/RimL family protein N-acetyltransferase
MDGMNSPDNQTIETERLILKPPVAADFAAFARMWSNPMVTQHILPAPMDRENAWRLFLRDLGHWKLNDFGYFSCFDKQTNAYAGTLGLARLERNLEPSFGDSPEAGWALSPEFHGKGLASEGLRAVLQWGEAVLLPTRFVCMVGETNIASGRVAQKCGFRKYAYTTYHGNSVILHERKS